MSSLIQNSGSSYRRDIDGLRAIAVLAVVLYHLGVPGVPGGFVGVDVFFVISGYLISKLLFAEFGEHRFSLIQFYERRARRILPALCVMLAATSAVAYALFYPTELDDFAASLRASVLFSANNYFYFTSNYFAPTAERLPLLHLWSLGIEEQFYLLFPLLLLGLRHYSLPIRQIAILAICLVSFSASAFLTHRYPTMAFFLLPCRAFELLVGSLVALSPRPQARSTFLTASAVMAGLGAVFLSIFAFNTQIVFPGFAAMLPCVGTALIIWGGSGQITPASSVLGTPPLVSVGRISYSLYLFHWPVLVFGHQLFPSTMSLLKPVGFFVASVLLAVLSTRFVEQPFRTSKLWSRRRIFAAAAPALILLCAAAQITQAEKGFPSRFDHHLVGLQAYAKYDPANQFRESTCFLKPEQTAISPENEKLCFPQGGTHHALLWGDSLAAHLFVGLDSAFASQGWTLAQATASACAPILGVDQLNRPNCRGFNDQIFARIEANKPDLLILASSWDVLPSELAPLEATFAELERVGIHTVILGPTPRYDAAVPNILADRIQAGNHSRLADGLMNSIAVRVEARMRVTASKYGLAYVSILDRLCANGNCPLTTSTGVPLQFDTLHLTAEGSHFVAEKIAPAILTAHDPSPSPGRVMN